jgi:membrane-bound ClpP family serine protease
MTFVRYGIPLLLFLGGVLMLVLEPNTVGIEGFAMATGAALAVLLLNALFRAGVKGDRERDREAEAREYLEKHGRWPD